MSTSFEPSLPSDIRLLLRADAEQCWLRHEVIPVLRELESERERPEEEVGAALAYLEAMWDQATLRARETDAARMRLRSGEGRCATLAGPAGRYHAAVRALRALVAKRVAPLVEPPFEEDRIRFADARPDRRDAALRSAGALDSIRRRA